MIRRVLGGVAVWSLVASCLQAQVSYERLLSAGSEPHNWLTYSGSYQSQRHSALTQVTPRAQIPKPPPNVFVGWLTVIRRGPTFCDLRYLAAISS